MRTLKGWTKRYDGTRKDFRNYKAYGITQKRIQGLVDGFCEKGETVEHALVMIQIILAFTFAIPENLKFEDWTAFSKETSQDIKEQYDQLKEELLIAARYRGYGVSGIMVDNLVQDGIKRGLSRKAAVAGVKLGLSIEYGQHEYFTADDVSEILNASVDEAENMIKNSGAGITTYGGLSTAYLQ